MIINPVLKGFNPDPSAVKVGNTVYIAVSTFQWVPGVRIYQTKDLVNYEYCTDVLIHSDFRGNPKDCSIWAPQLSYVDDEFYLLYTEIISTNRPFKDGHNYLIRSKDIKGLWSEPIYLNSSGFDPSMYHEKDKSYLLNCIWDYRMTTPNKSAGIIMQEYSREKQKLIGEPIKIFNGTNAAKTEAPHLYKINDYYYLITAEGGTGVDHQVTVCRSKALYGPYEVDPNTPLLTSKEDKTLPLQCAGHGSLIMFENRWYMYHLVTRPLLKDYAVLGRETAIQELVMTKDFWLKLKSTDNKPLLKIESPYQTTSQFKHYFKDDFSTNKLHHEWNMLAYYDSSIFNQSNQGLEITSKESLQSLFDVSLIGKRLTTTNFYAETSIKFNPTHFNQMAGMGLYLNVENFFYAYITYDEIIGKCVRYFKKEQNVFHLYETKTPIVGEVVIKIITDNHMINVYINHMKQDIEENTTFLSGGFTGTYIFLSTHDLNTFKGSKATFKYFVYDELK